MKNYILGRVARCILAIVAVVTIVIIMLYTLIPREQIFKLDTSIQKMKGDVRTTYVNSKLDELGYLNFVTQAQMCKDSDNPNMCKVNGSKEFLEIAEKYENDGYTINYFESGQAYAIHEFTVFELVGHFYGQFFQIDHLNKVQDEANPELQRKYYFGSDNAGNFGIMCSGCEYKYQLYFNSSFPFVHQNFLKFKFGTSYPTKVGVDTFDLIMQGQGAQKQIEQTFPTGVTQNSALLQSSCRYKSSSTLDHMDTAKFTDNYANCSSNYESPSMVSTSLLFGLLSLVFAYLISIPAGVYMARKKGKLGDKIGIAYINFLSSVPSLAFIFFMRAIGSGLSLPDKFPTLGFADVRSYVMPILVLTLLNTTSLMMWTRRYMIDQANSDYVKFAKAKGLSESEIFNRHILKNAIIPIVNGIPMSIVACLSGSVITESVFAIPGMGKMLPDAINQLNNTMVITLTFIFTSFSVFAVLAGDLLMTVVDPRIKLSDKGGK